MPYIKRKDRPELKNFALKLSDMCATEGELNYAITVMLHRQVENLGKRYKNLNMLMGVLICVRDEFYRKIITPYEDKKIEENGDIGILEG